MSTISIDPNKRYTFADYLTWPDNKRRELIDGFVQLMTPAPRRIHQELSGSLFTELSLYLKKHKCKVYPAPFDVRLPENEEKEGDKIYTVVQPDISVICDLSKLDEYGCIDPPT